MEVGSELSPLNFHEKKQFFKIKMEIFALKLKGVNSCYSLYTFLNMNIIIYNYFVYRLSLRSIIYLIFFGTYVILFEKLHNDKHHNI